MGKKRKFAVITGAGGTLCSCIAKHLAGQGVAVALIGRSYDKLKMVGDEIDKLGGEYVIKCADVTDKERIREIAGELYSKFGACDYLINGAGGNQMMAMTTLTEYDPAELSEQRPEGMRGFFDLDMDVYESVLKINTVGTVVCCQVFGEQMAMAGGGAIINFASMNTYCPLTRVPAYAMSKAAIENYTRWLANYLAPANIRVNAIAPGFFLNERSAKFLGTVEGGLTPRGEQVIGHTPMRRFGEASDLLGCVDFLLSETGAGFVTGVTIPVDGGFLTKSGV
ncbi:MAG: SDR family oxidoreductase [Clostridia bacterium]|nr:SDR family oxidoreductase [Clostridia bacterium]